MSKVVDEAESQEYLDAIQRLEPEVDDLARKIVDNLNIDVSTPDDNATPTFVTEYLYSFLNEDPLSLLMSSLSGCLILAYSLNVLSK